MSPLASIQPTKTFSLEAVETRPRAASVFKRLSGPYLRAAFLRNAAQMTGCGLATRRFGPSNSRPKRHSMTFLSKPMRRVGFSSKPRRRFLYQKGSKANLARLSGKSSDSGLYVPKEMGSDNGPVTRYEPDRMIILVGPEASGTITSDLTKALASLQAPSSAPPPQAQKEALEKLKSSLTASWEKLFSTTPLTQDVDAILQFVSILRFDPLGPDRRPLSKC